jgi:hypothetical protein
VVRRELLAVSWESGGGKGVGFPRERRLETSEETRRRLIDLLQLAYSGEKAAALAYRGHARSVRTGEAFLPWLRTSQRRSRSDRLRCRSAIEKIERDEWIHREKVGRLLQRLGSGPRRIREIRSGLVGHVLGALCRVSGWFLPMYFAGRLETRNVAEYERAAGWARELGLTEFLPDLAEMAAVEVEHEKFFEILGRPAPEQAASSEARVP